ncbi:hypothetical protein OS493_036685 [Desmophyllum pertusum]|uniref:Uncharacterized protein n=1 Tax=Desmophyllum pertusum TaxID=174260 RepID=A0A9W9ZVF2_9CNID|nr:hypothetical protein OS493_036685 [Desmophyllum pertusum]
MTSSCSSERSRKAKAELLRRELELKNLLKQQELERRIAEVKEQEDELKRRIVLLVAEGEMEKAKVVDEIYQSSEYSKRYTKKELKVNVAKRVADAESRLAYLIQHCTGKAREAIKNCSIISEPEQGYQKAQEIVINALLDPGSDVTLCNVSLMKKLGLEGQWNFP